MSNIIEIDGVKHQEVETSPRTKKYLNGKMGAFMAMSMMMCGVNAGGGSGEPEMPSYDLVEEYKLILQKKSKLSRAQRD